MIGKPAKQNGGSDMGCTAHCSGDDEADPCESCDQCPVCQVQGRSGQQHKRTKGNRSPKPTAWMCICRSQLQGHPCPSYTSSLQTSSRLSSTILISSPACRLAIYCIRQACQVPEQVHAFIHNLAKADPLGTHVAYQVLICFWTFEMTGDRQAR